MISWRRLALAFSCLAVFATTSLMSPTPAGSQDRQSAALNRQVLELLNQRVLEFFRAKNYREAQTVAEHVVATAQAGSGEKHPDHIRALIQLGQILTANRAPDAV